MFGHRFWGSRFFGSRFWAPKTDLVVTGQSVTVSVGTVTVSGKAIVPVTGQSMTASVGKVNNPVTGQVITCSVGSVTVIGKANVTVSGQSVSAQVGSASVSIGVHVLLDVSSTACVMPAPNAGAVIAKTGATLSVTGQAVTAFVGTVILHYAYKVFLPAGVGLQAFVGQVTSPNWGTIPDTIESWTGAPPPLDDTWTDVNGSHGSGWADETSVSETWTDVASPGNNWTSVNG